MSDLDLVGLRKIAEAARKMWGNLIPVHGAREYQRATGPKTVIALLDRIEELEAEVAELTEALTATHRNGERDLQKMESAWGELAELKAKLDKIRARHLRAGTQAQSVCVHCDVAWPCETIKILDGDADE